MKAGNEDKEDRGAAEAFASFGRGSGGSRRYYIHDSILAVRARRAPGGGGGGGAGAVAAQLARSGGNCAPVQH